jgi:diguanylate cyclase (GGDEF)-like protein
VKADEVLELVRPLIVEIDGLGTIRRAHGGYGGFLGHRPSAMIAKSVFDFVDPADAHELTAYFVETVESSLDTVTMPLPFRVRIVGADGRSHPVDIIPTASEHVENRSHTSWVVVILPIALSTSASRSLDAEMAGAPRQRVKELLTEELAFDNSDDYTSQWFMIDLLHAAATGRIEVSTARPADQPFARLLGNLAQNGEWTPWNDVAPHDAKPIPLDDLPTPLRIEAARVGWQRFVVAPVHVDGELAAVYLQAGVVPADYGMNAIKTNIMVRIKSLVDVTALLLTRWRDQDRLRMAATCDSLTGVANRDAFSDALSESEPGRALLYVDIDRFKAVNDQLGHDVGDRVLIEVSRRIASACRPGDIVARYGGDEFVVLLKRVDYSAACAIGERIIGDVAAPMKIAGCDQVTVSIGVAVVDGDSDVINAADRAMLHAKRSGRNQLVRS